MFCAIDWSRPLDPDWFSALVMQVSIWKILQSAQYKIGIIISIDDILQQYLGIMSS